MRFEDHNPEEARRTVQEFRPSRDRSYAEEAGRARREQEAKKEPAPAPKSSGLFGWMKSILGSKPEESTETPAREQGRQDRPRGQGQDRGPRRDRPQGGGFGAQPGGERGGPGGGEGGEGGGRRRRRRRGGRNRNRGEGGGGGDRGESRGEG
ncbi:MAG: hypothetical protein IAE82_17280 [Opitutaceae bacterium]|nr:hypothetical protein [Opitutaceae bacterium]